MRQVEEEYWKFTDTSGVGNATNQAQMAPTQTPDTKQAALAAFPTERRKILEGWIDDLNVPPSSRGLEPRVDGSVVPRIQSPANETRLSV